MIQEEWLCPICLESGDGNRSGVQETENGSVYCIAPCGHIFHTNCITQWMHKDPCGLGFCMSGPCPVCREEVTQLNLMPLEHPPGRTWTSNVVVDVTEHQVLQQSEYDDNAENGNGDQVEVIPEQEVMHLLPSHPIFMAVFLALFAMEFWSHWGSLISYSFAVILALDNYVKAIMKLIVIVYVLLVWLILLLCIVCCCWWWS